jgi:hypothetical protein
MSKKYEVKLGPNAQSFSSPLSNLTLVGDQVKEVNVIDYDRDGILQDAVKGGHVILIIDGVEQPVPGGTFKGGDKIIPGKNVSEELEKMETAGDSAGSEVEITQANAGTPGMQNATDTDVDTEAATGGTSAEGDDTQPDQTPEEEAAEEAEEEDEDDDDDETELETKTDYIDAIKEHPKAKDDEKKGLTSLTKDDLVELYKKINKRK